MAGNISSSLVINYGLAVFYVVKVLAHGSCFLTLIQLLHYSDVSTQLKGLLGRKVIIFNRN